MLYAYSISQFNGALSLIILFHLFLESFKRRRLTLFLLLASGFYISSYTLASNAETENIAKTAKQSRTWLDIVNTTPYWDSKGIYENLKVIRRWVLLESGYCEKPERHILYDRRGRFLTYFSNLDSPEANQTQLNRVRRRLVESGKAEIWTPGNKTVSGYPFALTCDQPHVDISKSVNRFLGKKKKDKIWGTWDGLKVGKKSSGESLFHAVTQVYSARAAQNRFTFPTKEMKYLLGQVIIESGARKASLSQANAKGLMQLRPEVLSDCRIPKKHHLHRMAQIDCALKLIEQNHRNLQQPFLNVFGGLPKAKKERLYNLLLIQAYHGGIGRATALLAAPELNSAALYFATYESNFSAEDIALALVYHNLGKKNLGLASLHYFTDVGIVAEHLCTFKIVRDSGWC